MELRFLDECEARRAWTLALDTGEGISSKLGVRSLGLAGFVRARALVAERVNAGPGRSILWTDR
jgi:hypothetical protein